jgi:5-methylcytosine-specific restriction endonuclease McrA
MTYNPYMQTPTMTFACVVSVTARKPNMITRKRVLREKGRSCVSCGANKGEFHEDGSRVNITMDHIFPYAKGGCNHFHNLQPMCEKCNVAKADKYDGTEFIINIRDLLVA